MSRVAFLAVMACLAVAPATPAPGREAPARAQGAYRPVALTTDWHSKVRLVSVTYPQWLRELDSLRGRIVVVDCWATWCAPCVERFPRMMAMARKWTRSGVAFVTLSLDDRDDAATIPKVRGFLEKQSARMPNYLMNEITPDAFDRLGLLGVPAVFIYDRNGKLVSRLTGDDPNHQFTDADVEAAIGKLVTARGRAGNR